MNRLRSGYRRPGENRGACFVSGDSAQAEGEKTGGTFPVFSQKNFGEFGCIAYGNMVRCFACKDKWP